MSPIRPLFRSNGRSGTTPQCHGIFQDWVGDPLRGKDEKPLDARRGATLRTEIMKHPDGLGFRLVGRPIPKDESVPGADGRAKS
jgi:hypothetical protein